MPHVFYSPALAAAQQMIWSNINYHPSMKVWERKFYTVNGAEVEGNLESTTSELPEKLATRYTDAEYRGEGEITRTLSMGEAARSVRR